MGHASSLNQTLVAMNKTKKGMDLARPISPVLFSIVGLVGCFVVAQADEPAVADRVQAEPVATLALLKDRTGYRHSLSPDGGSVAFVAWTPSGNYLLIRSTSNRDDMVDIPFGAYTATDIQWLSSTRLIYQVDGRLLAINTDGTDNAVLLDYLDPNSKKTQTRKDIRVWSISHLLPDDPEHILVQSRDLKGNPAVVRLNIYTGGQTIVVSEPELDVDAWLVDRTGEVRLAIRFDKDRVEMLSRSKTSRQWTVYDNYSNESKNTLGFTGQTYLTRRLNLEAFDFDNEHIYVATNRNSDKFGIVKYSLDDRSATENVYASESYDVGGPSAEWESLLFLDSEEKLVGVRFAEDKLRTVWLDDRFREYQTKLDETLKDHENTLLQWSTDGAVFLVHSYSDTDPGRFWIYKPGENKLDKFSEINDQLVDAMLSQTQVVKIAARDGYELEGYLNLPTRHDGKPTRLIVYPHGGPWARDYWEFEPWVQFFATRGYAVLRVNFRGSTGYGREHLLAGIKNIDTVMIDDITDGATWAIEQGVADPESLFIFGHSYGGYAALMSTVHYPGLYKAAVSWAAPLSMPDQIKRMRKEDEFLSYEFWKTAVGDPRKERDTLRRLSPHFNIDRLNDPILIFHGKTDAIVSVEQVENFEKALKKAGKTVEVTVINNEGHTFQNNNNTKYVLEKTLRFFESHENALH